MVRGLVLKCLILSQLLVSVAGAGVISEDLYWYKASLGFSQISEKGIDSYLNPFEGPQEFRLNEKTAPWAGNYFPMMDGGIAQRWRDGVHPEQMHNRETFLKLSEKQRQKLSPVEKYDALLGLYDFRTTSHEMNFRGPFRPGAKIQDWEGFCNGMRCAGIMLPEPQFSVERLNPDGIKVVFQPADLKALAGASYFYTEKYAQIGAPTSHKKAENQPNAAVFDLVLRYGLAKNNQAFIIDSHLGSEIWNETVVGYRRTLSEKKSLNSSERTLYPNAVVKVDVELILETLGEVDIQRSNKTTKPAVADGSLLQTLEGRYTLYLNDQGQAIDGRWKKNSGTRGVDFAWFVGGKGADKEYAFKGGNPHLEFSIIKKLIQESAHPLCGKLFL